MDPSEFHLIPSPSPSVEGENQERGGVFHYLLSFISFGQSQTTLENHKVTAVHPHPAIVYWASFHASMQEWRDDESNKPNPEDLKTKIFRQRPEINCETRALERELFNWFMNAFLFSISREEFLSKIDHLLQNENSRDFLDQAFLLLDSHREEICNCMAYHQKYAKKYDRALAQAKEDGIQIELAFADEKSPTFEQQIISVSFIRLYAALMRFQQAYGWMMPLAVCQEEARFATHILTHLVCGRNAPVLEKMGENLCCFKVEDFSNHSEASFSLKPEKTFLDYMGDRFIDQTVQENRLKKMFEEALPLFISDMIHRSDYAIKIGHEVFEVAFRNQKDLDKPFFLEAILKHSLSVDSDSLDILSLDELKELFKKRDNPIIDTIFERLIICIEGLPIQLQKGAILKLMEMIILFNQQLFSLGSHEVVKKMNEIVNSGCLFGVSNKDNFFSFEMIPPQCDALCISGICSLSIQNTKKLQRIAPVRCGYSVEIPSLRKKENPVIRFTDLFFSPETPLYLLEQMKTQCQLDQEWIMTLSPEGLSVRFATLLEFIKKKENQNKFPDHQMMLSFYRPLFLQAFAIDQTINLLELIKMIKKNDLDHLMKIREDLMKKLRQVLAQIHEKFKENQKENNYQQFVQTVCKWFPELG